MHPSTVTTPTLHTTTLDDSAVAAFQSRLQGTLVQPGHPDYDEARRVWNGMIDRRPALIARCTSEDDVVEAVHFARENDLLVAVRGGGHNVAGTATCDGGLVIDCSPMKTVEVDPARRVVHAGGGCTWGDVDRATQAYGLATPGGVVSDTGIAGLTLGGGFGWLSWKHGLSGDNLIGAEVVTADGRRVTASETENADLLWGLRGGGGNFGVVTRFTYRLHEVGPDVFLCFAFHDGRGRGMHDALRFFRNFCATAPDEAGPLAACGVIPPHAEVFPESIHGIPFVLFGAMYAGSPEEGERVLAPLRTFAEPLVDFSGTRPFVEAQTMFDEDYPAHELRYYWKSLHLTSLSDEVIDRIVEHAKRQPSPLSTTDVWPLGGAIRRTPPGGSAFQGRHVPYLINPEANWVDADDDAANIAWVRDTVAAMQPYSDGGRYLNFAGFYEEGESAVKKSFGSAYERLTALKKRYDPTNRFRLNQNISPA